MYTLEQLTQTDQLAVNKLPPEHRQMMIDILGAANAKAEADRKTLEVLLNEVNADGKPAKGAVQVYGLGRFPISLHIEQWRRLIGFIPTVEAFISNEVNVQKSNSIRKAYREYEKTLKASTPNLTVAK